MIFSIESLAARVVCSPVGQVAHAALVNSQKLIFQRWQTDLVFESAQVNTINCRERHQFINESQLKQARLSIAAGQAAFYLVQKGEALSDSRCLIEVIGLEEFEAKSFKFSKDSCLNQGLIKVQDLVTKKEFYLKSASDSKSAKKKIKGLKK